MNMWRAPADSAQARGVRQEEYVACRHVRVRDPLERAAVFRHRDRRVGESRPEHAGRDLDDQGRRYAEEAGELPGRAYFHRVLLPIREGNRGEEVPLVYCDCGRGGGVNAAAEQNDCFFIFHGVFRPIACHCEEPTAQCLFIEKMKWGQRRSPDKIGISLAMTLS